MPNRFIKRAAANKTVRYNWFTKLPPKVQREIREAVSENTGSLLDLGRAIKDELQLETSAQQICAVLRTLNG